MWHWNIEDRKPGWLLALFGNDATEEDQVTLTYSSASQTNATQTQTATVYFYAAPGDPPYLVGLYFDRLLGTFVFTPWQPVQTKPPFPVSPVPVEAPTV